MIVERWTWKVKPGCQDEMIKLLKALIEETGLTPRVWTFRFGPGDIVGSDIEFETEEDRQKWWREVDASKPKAAEFAKKHHDLIRASALRELVRVH